MRYLPALVTVLSLALLAACGGDDDDARSEPQGSARGGTAVGANSGSIALQAFTTGLETDSDASAAIAEGITVTGYGDATDVPTGATIRLEIGDDGFFSGSSSPLLELIDPEEVQPLVDLIEEQGVNDEDITVNTLSQSQFGYGASATITFPWSGVDGLNELVDELADGTRQETEYDLIAFNVLFTVDDCEQLEEAAQEAAIEDARQRAGRLAELGGLDLGDIVAIADAGSFTSLYGLPQGCAAFEDVAAIDLFGANPGNSPEQVEIDSTLTVTFAAD